MSTIITNIQMKGNLQIKDKAKLCIPRGTTSNV